MVDNSLPPSDGSHAKSAGRSLGRFSLRQLLGRNEVSMAWLAFDPHLGHDVMLNLPRVQPKDAQGLIEWDRRARWASRLSHPHLAQVLEVGVEAHWPYLMIDRATGVTLDEWLLGHPSPSPLEVVTLLCQALEGLAFAHEAGGVHGHIEGYTLVVSDNAQVCWMGLGLIAQGSEAAVGEAHSQMDLHTLQGQRVGATRDVLSLGVLLHRLLTGQMPLGQSEISSTLQLLPPQGHAQIHWPRHTPQPVSEALRAITDRATSAQQSQRYLNARSFLRALEGWRDSETQGRSSPFDVLIERINSIGHLPSNTPKVRSSAKWARWEAQRTDEIAQQVLADMGLTLEMLRQVNSPQVQSLQGESFAPVMTVRRAIALRGINGVRRGTLVLRDWPGPLTESAASLLQGVMDRVRLSGVLAQLLAPAGYDGEMVYIVNLLQNLGRLLVHYHFPEEAEQIRHLMQPVPPTEPGLPAQPGLSETAASFGVLGMNIEALGAMVAQHWNLGDDVQYMMRRLPLQRPVRTPTPEADLDWLRLAASAAHEVVDGLHGLPADQGATVLAGVAQRYARTLSVDDRALQDLFKKARELTRKGRLILRQNALSLAEPEADSDQTGHAEAQPLTGLPHPGQASPVTSLRERLRAKVIHKE